MKIFLVIAVAFACIPDSQFYAFSIIYAAMLPFTALAYDERSKWNELAAMLPYTDMEIVFSKYLLGYIGIVPFALLAFLVQNVMSAVRGAACSFSPAAAVVIACFAAILLAVNLPLMIRFGVEKGRLVFFLIVLAIVAAGIFAGDDLSAVLKAGSTGVMALAAFGTAAALNALSAVTAVRLYRKRRMEV